MESMTRCLGADGVLVSVFAGAEQLQVTLQSTETLPVGELSSFNVDVPSQLLAAGRLDVVELRFVDESYDGLPRLLIAFASSLGVHVYELLIAQRSLRCEFFQAAEGVISCKINAVSRVTSDVNRRADVRLLHGPALVVVSNDQLLLCQKRCRQWSCAERELPYCRGHVGAIVSCIALDTAPDASLPFVNVICRGADSSFVLSPTHDAITSSSMARVPSNLLESACCVALYEADTLYTVVACRADARRQATLNVCSRHQVLKSVPLPAAPLRLEASARKVLVLIPQPDNGATTLLGFHTSSLELQFNRPNVLDFFQDLEGNVVVVEDSEGDSTIVSVVASQQKGEIVNTHLHTLTTSLSQTFERECSELERMIQMITMKKSMLSGNTVAGDLEPLFGDSASVDRRRSCLIWEPSEQQNSPTQLEPRMSSCTISSSLDHCIEFEALVYNPGKSLMTDVSLSFLSSACSVSTESQCCARFEGGSMVSLSARLSLKAVSASCACVKGTLVIIYGRPPDNSCAIASVGTLCIPTWTSFGEKKLIEDKAGTVSPLPLPEHAIQSGIILSSNSNVLLSKVLSPSLKSVPAFQLTLPNGCRRELYRGGEVCVQSVHIGQHVRLLLCSQSLCEVRRLFHCISSNSEQARLSVDWGSPSLLRRCRALLLQLQDETNLVVRSLSDLLTNVCFRGGQDAKRSDIDASIRAYDCFRTLLMQQQHRSDSAASGLGFLLPLS